MGTVIPDRLLHHGIVIIIKGIITSVGQESGKERWKEDYP